MDLSVHLREVSTAVSTSDDALWQTIKVINLDPAGIMKKTKRARLVLIDEDDLTCPICLELFEGHDQPQQCINGHTFCSICCPASSNACPVCKVKGSYGRSLLTQSISRMLLFQCSDCKEIMSNSQKASHVWNCGKRQTKCPFCHECSICMDELKNHFEQSHLHSKTQTLYWIFSGATSMEQSVSHVWSVNDSWTCNERGAIAWLKSYTMTSTDIVLDAHFLIPPGQNPETCIITIRIICDSKEVFACSFKEIELPNWWSDRSEDVTRLPVNVFEIIKRYKNQSKSLFMTVLLHWY